MELVELLPRDAPAAGQCPDSGTTPVDDFLNMKGVVIAFCDHIISDSYMVQVTLYVLTPSLSAMQNNLRHLVYPHLFSNAGPSRHCRVNAAPQSADYAPPRCTRHMATIPRSLQGSLLQGTPHATENSLEPQGSSGRRLLRMEACSSIIIVQS